MHQSRTIKRSNENKFYNDWVNTWRCKSIINLFFIVFGGVIGYIVIAITKQEQIAFTFIFDVFPNFESIIASIAGAFFAVGGIILGFSSIFIFNFIQWTDKKLDQSEEKIDYIIIGKAFSKFSITYFNTSITLILIHIVILMYSYISTILSAILFLYDIIGIMALIEGFKIIMVIVLGIVDVEYDMIKTDIIRNMIKSKENNTDKSIP